MLFIISLDFVLTAPVLSFIIIYLRPIMKGDRMCHRVLLKSSKEREGYIRREENYI